MLYGCEDSLYLAHKDLRMTKIEQRKKMRRQKRSPERQFVITLSHLVVVLFS